MVKVWTRDRKCDTCELYNVMLRFTEVMFRAFRCHLWVTLLEESATEILVEWIVLHQGIHQLDLNNELGVSKINTIYSCAIWSKEKKKRNKTLSKRVFSLRFHNACNITYYHVISLTRAETMRLDSNWFQSSVLPSGTGKIDIFSITKINI